MKRAPSAIQIGKAASYPGIDPRVWACVARVEEDGAAWHPELGWLVYVTTYGSRIDGETEVPVRVAGSARGDGTGEFLPPGDDQEVLVTLCGGSLEEGPVAVAYCSNAATSAAPKEIHGLPISGTASGPASVSPFDTEIKVSRHNRREQFDGDFERRSTKSRIEASEKAAIVAPDVRLAGDDASESYVLGDSYTSALSAALDAIAAQVELISGVVPDASGSIAAGLVQMKAALLLQKQSLSAALSKKIKGE